ncbi:malonyl CoA-acyl carrier protein transacylase [Chloroflexus islandicus]|uniref:Malonyl CoA-acyl carrier protein transacylase n=1 Tax=Chloroflexus islandicus TaxID=1707952 RepID=A0A178M7A7_9CHLR|nr:ACP S-malonyltransferase [Chloroflexus islandicus]OAN44396.1 malonyl CoA-acyl carrier protein transacylase [Chloroflexus islandicus]
MSIAWVFPGQGSQVVGMGRDLIAASAAARQIFATADETLDFGLSELCFSGPETDLTATENAQPALLTTSMALLAAMRELLGDRLEPPIAVAGHSLGEYSALVAGGSLDFTTALRLVRRRGELMAAAHDGSMAAVIGLDAGILEQICQEVSAALQHHNQLHGTVVIANYNAPDQLVISGSVVAVEHASLLAKSRGAKRVIPLKVSAAFHSPLMVEAAEGMAQAIASATVRDLDIPLIANVTAEPLRDADDVRREMVAQVVAPVRWIASVQHMVAMGVETFVEIGPGRVLTGLIRRIAPAARLINVATFEDVRALTAMQPV